MLVSEILGKAQAKQQHGDLDAAESLYRCLLDANVDTEEIRNALAVVYLQGGKPQLAVDVLRDFACDSDDPKTLVHLGIALSRAEEHDAAVTIFARAEKLAPDYADVHYNSAKAMALNGDRVGALAAYRRTAELAPDRSDAYFNAGNILRDEGRLEQAAEQYRSALSVEPTFLKALRCLGQVLIDLNRFEEAGHCFRKVLEHDPGDSKSNFQLAVALARSSHGIIHEVGEPRQAAGGSAQTSGHSFTPPANNETDRELRPEARAVRGIIAP